MLQVARHDDYQARAENNRIREIPIPASRGASSTATNESWSIAFQLSTSSDSEDITDKEDTLKRSCTESGCRSGRGAG